jgi:hypothetical protein
MITEYYKTLTDILCGIKESISEVELKIYVSQIPAIRSTMSR